MRGRYRVRRRFSAATAAATAATASVAVTTAAVAASTDDVPVCIAAAAARLHMRHRDLVMLVQRWERLLCILLPSASVDSATAATAVAVTASVASVAATTAVAIPAAAAAIAGQGRPTNRELRMRILCVSRNRLIQR